MRDKHADYRLFGIKIGLIPLILIGALILAGLAVDWWCGCIIGGVDG